MKRLLFVTPALPWPTGSGLQMRAWLSLEALRRQRAVTLVVGSPAFPIPPQQAVEEVRARVEQVVLLDFRPGCDPFIFARSLGARLGWRPQPAWDWARPTPLMLQKLAVLHDRTFDEVHAFRLSMLPVALAALPSGSRAPIDLDLDDWESETRLALADLAAPCEPALARRYTAEAAAFARVESDWLRRFRRVFVGSPGDAAALAARYGLHNTVVMANAIEVPATLPAPSRDEPPDLLFVGSLGYFPNRHAVEFLLGQVLPALGASVRLTVAGAGARPSLCARMRRPGCRWVCSPARMDSLYARARLALAPVRAGGGTRIKALEAFAQGRPLVATRTAVAGLDVEAGVHYLAAESASEWVAAIETLLAQPTHGERLARAAFAWVGQHALARRIDQLADLVGAAGHLEDWC